MDHLGVHLSSDKNYFILYANCKVVKKNQPLDLMVFTLIPTIHIVHELLCWVLLSYEITQLSTEHTVQLQGQVQNTIRAYLLQVCKLPLASLLSDESLNWSSLKDQTCKGHFFKVNI